MPLTEALIDECVERYWREFDRYAKLVALVEQKCRKILEEKLIRGTVSSRAKDPERLRGKLRRYMRNDEERESLDSVEKIFQRLGDLAGVRVATYVEKDRDRVVEELRACFCGDSEGGEITVDKKDIPGKSYRAIHCQVLLNDADFVGNNVNLKGLNCEIQVCSLLAHVYNEIEHDIRYKALSGEPSGHESQLLDVLGTLTVAGDGIVKSIFEAKEIRQSAYDLETIEFDDEYDFVARMRTKFPNTSKFAENAYQLYEELIAFGLDSPEKIKEELLQDEYDTRAHVLLMDLEDFCNKEQPIVVTVDFQSSDRLLVLFLEKYASQVEFRHPAGPGCGRPARIRSLATRFRKMIEIQD